MIDSMLPCLFSLSLAVTMPDLAAQDQTSPRAEPLAPVVGVFAEPADVAPVRNDGAQSGVSEEAGVVGIQRLSVQVHALPDGGFQFEIRQLDGLPGHPYLIVCFQAGAVLVPIAILDGQNQAELTFDVDLDRFAAMPIAVMPARVRETGAIDFGPLVTAAALAARARD